MSSRTRSRSPASIGSNQSSRRWVALSACDCRAAEFVLLLVIAWSPPAVKRRDCLGFSTRRLRHLQFQPHPGRHPRMGEGTVLKEDMIMPRAELVRTEFYNDWIRPQRVRDCLSAM